jgi:hypothetical protein
LDKKMVTYKAVISFDDATLGKIKRGQELNLAEASAKKYVDAKLLTQVADAAAPKAPTGTQLSASPVGPASPKPTAKKSARGASKVKAAQS